MTAVFFAWHGNSWTENTLSRWDWGKRPIHILVALPYLQGYERRSVNYGAPLSTILDSGAFSTWKSGMKIDIDDLIARSRSGYWDECVALDVIGDSEGSVKNALYMKQQGATVIPVFHYGEDWGVLRDYCAEFGRVGLSCRFGEPEKDSLRWVDQCFSRAWPHLFHSFGWVIPRTLVAVPFDTADASSWQQGPTAFGSWYAFDGKKIGLRCNKDNPAVVLDAEIEHCLEMQQRLEELWARDLHDLRLATLGESLTRRRTLSTSFPGEVGASWSRFSAASSRLTAP